MAASRSIRIYFLNRLLLAAATIFFLATVLFVLFRLLPGDPTLTVLSPALSPEVQVELRQRFGLDRPLPEQYVRYVTNLLVGNFGVSFHRGVPVSQLLGQHLVSTIALMLPSLWLAYALGIVIGALIAWRRGSFAETATTTAAVVFRSAPIFWVAIIFISVFAVRLGIFPSGHMRTPGTEPGGVLATFFHVDFLHHLALPMCVMAVYYGCYPLLVMRASMLEVLGEDFIDLCKAKGLSERRVIFKHALRASLLPIATSVSLLGAYVVAGSVLVEQVFSWPGLGRLMVQAVTDSDYPVAQATFLLIAVLVVLGNLLADVLYGFLDPRIRYR
jgi:peptide/nickel transport system permease protein